MIRYLRFCLVACAALLAAAQLATEDTNVNVPNWCLSHRCVPNYNILGTGIDVVTGATKGPLISLVFAGKNVTLGKWGIFSVPDHVGASTLGTTNIVSNVITSTEEFSRVIAADMGILADDLTASYFSQWSRFREYAQRANRDWLITTRWSRPLFQIDLSLSGLERRSPLFMHDVQKLPMTYVGNEKAYSDFLERWGTHLVTDLVFGGYLELLNYANGCDSKALGSRYVAMWLRGKFDQIAGIEDISLIPNRGWIDLEDLYRDSILRSVGGVANACSTSACNWNNFVKSIDIANIGVIQQKVAPISWILGDDPQIATNIDLAVKNYLLQNTAENKGRVYCVNEHTVRDKSWKIWGLIAIGIIAVLSLLLAAMLIRYATKVHFRERDEAVVVSERQRLVVPVARVERYDATIPIVTEPAVVERP